MFLFNKYTMLFFKINFIMAMVGIIKVYVVSEDTKQCLIVEIVGVNPFLIKIFFINSHY